MKFGKQDIRFILRSGASHFFTIQVGVIGVAVVLLTSNGWCGSGSSSKSSDASSIGNAVEVEQIDLIELNHFLDEDGRQVFRQVIFYDWSKIEKRFLVRGWRLIKNDSQLPRRYWKPNRYECVWYESSTQRKVIAKQMRETWSQQDPERMNREILPEDQRVPLFAKRKPATTVENNVHRR